MKYMMRALSACTTAVLASLPAVGARNAVSAPGGGSLAQPATQLLQEVVVTAEKRKSNLMTTAVAMSAQSGSQLRAEHVANLEQLTATTPSFTYANQGPTSAVNIRGIGMSVTSPNVAPGVPLYRDGLLAPTLLPNEPFLDIADVEVLRGPQGTLVGANSTGGAVFFNTVDPRIGATDGYLAANFATYAKVSVQGAKSIPVNDELAFRVAAYYKKRDSYWTDTVPSSANHPAPGAVNQAVLRLTTLYRPTRKLSMLLKINYQDDQNGGMAHSPVAGTNVAATWPTGRYELAYPDTATQYSDYQIRTGLTIAYHFDDGITLRSLSGFFYTYEYYNDQQFLNAPGGAAISAPFINRIQDHVFSQEFDVLSPSAGPLHWVVGTFSQYWPAHINLNPNTMAVVVDEGTIKSTNALFGSVGYDLTRKVEVRVGLRETVNHAHGTGGVFLIPARYARLQGNAVDESDDFLTGRLGVNWRATQDQFLYAFVAKGAKTGGVNSQGTPNFAPEAVWDYEAGVKSTWLGGHARTQFGVFDMDYRNLQLAVVRPSAVAALTPQGSIANVGRSTIRGAELSAQALLEGWQVDGSVGYVHSAIGSSPLLLDSYLYQIIGLNPTGPQCAPGQSGGCFDYAPYERSVNGTSDPHSPQWTGSLGVQYTARLPDGGTLTPRLDYSYTSVQWATIFQNPIDRFQSHSVLDFGLTYGRGAWSITAYGTNVTNAYYITGQTGNANFWGAPAVYGVRFRERL